MEGSRARVAILATEGVERVELEQPRDALREAGSEAVLVSDRSDEVPTFNHLDRATTEPVDRESGATRGRSVTSWPSLRTDLVNAGASWDDREVVRDGNLVTSRGPDDLPASAPRWWSYPVSSGPSPGR